MGTMQFREVPTVSSSTRYVHMGSRKVRRRDRTLVDDSEHDHAQLGKLTASGKIIPRFVTHSSYPTNAGNKMISTLNVPERIVRKSPS